ncbi:unnamed protein product, partial [Sphacelaria rigidula]
AYLTARDHYLAASRNDRYPPPVSLNILQRLSSAPCILDMPICPAISHHCPYFHHFRANPRLIRQPLTARRSPISWRYNHHDIPSLLQSFHHRFQRHLQIITTVSCFLVHVGP